LPQKLNLHPLGQKGADGDGPQGRQISDLYIKCQEQQHGVEITSHIGSLFFPGTPCLVGILAWDQGILPSQRLDPPIDPRTAAQPAPEFGTNTFLQYTKQISSCLV